MKINFKKINFRRLLFLPLLTLIMAAQNPCDRGGGITVPGDGGGQGTVTAVLDTETTFANTIKITIPADSEITDLNVNATDYQTGETEQVLQITGLSPGEERTVTIPKLRREHSYRIDLVVPETGENAATLNLDTAFRVVFANRSATNNWGFNTGGTSQYGIVGGGYDQGPLYAEGILFPAGTAAASINAAVNADPIQPDFDIVLLKGEKENRGVQPAGTGFYDFDENGILDLVIASPSASNQNFELEAGRLFVIMNSIPTQDFELKDSTYILEGDDPDYRFASDTDYNPPYFLISVPGGSTNNATCKAKPKCGYCSVYDFKQGIHLTNIHTDGMTDYKRCRYAKFWDPDIDGVMGLVYLINNDIWDDGRSCRQVGVNADSITDPGTPMFTEAVGDRNCGVGPLILQKLDFNGDGHLDLSLTRLLFVPATGWETFVWLAGPNFNPNVFDYKFTGDENTGEYGGFWFKVDFNNDGVDEIINLLQNHMHIYYDGIESPPDIIPRSTPGSAGWFADFNGDGYIDLLSSFTDVMDNGRAFIMY